ncbi:MAG: hypothetical protein HYY40_05455 [Bacteroidetes bacterium]|nr:hypothetical protein [Bacteroidota bacterium]
MKFPIFLLLIFFWGGCSTKSVNNDDIIPAQPVSPVQHIEIYIEDYGSFYPKRLGYDTIVLGNNNYFAKVNLYDFRGKMQIAIFRPDSTLEVSGFFDNALDTFRAYSYIDNPDRDEMKISVEKYFEPLKDSIWYYFNEKGDTLKKRRYKYIISSKHHATR